VFSTRWDETLWRGEGDIPYSMQGPGEGREFLVLSDNIPTEEVYITDGVGPGTLESQSVKSPYGKVPDTYKHERIHMEPIMGDVKPGSGNVIGTNRP